MQARLILYILRRLPGKKGTIKEAQDMLRKIYGIRIPQSTVSARFGDLRDNGAIAFFGQIKTYKERDRKVFEIVTSRNKKEKSALVRSRWRLLCIRIRKYGLCYISLLVNGTL